MPSNRQKMTAGRLYLILLVMTVLMLVATKTLILG